MVNNLSPEKALCYRDKRNTSYRQIAEKCNISKSGVHKICNLKNTPIFQQTSSIRKVGRPKRIGKRLLLRTVRKLRERNESGLYAYIAMHAVAERSRGS